MAELLHALRDHTPLPSVFIAPSRRPESRWDAQARQAKVEERCFDKLQREFLESVHQGPNATVSCPAYAQREHCGVKRSQMPVLEAFFDQIGEAEQLKLLAILNEVANGRGGEPAARIGAQALIANAAKEHADLHAAAAAQNEEF